MALNNTIVWENSENQGEKTAETMHSGVCALGPVIPLQLNEPPDATLSKQVSN